VAGVADATAATDVAGVATVAGMDDDGNPDWAAAAGWTAAGAKSPEGPEGGGGGGTGGGACCTTAPSAAAIAAESTAAVVGTFGAACDVAGAGFAADFRGREVARLIEVCAPVVPATVVEALGGTATGTDFGCADCGGVFSGATGLFVSAFGVSEEAACDAAFAPASASAKLCEPGSNDVAGCATSAPVGPTLPVMKETGICLRSFRATGSMHAARQTVVPGVAPWTPRKPQKIKRIQDFADGVVVKQNLRSAMRKSLPSSPGKN